jgi:MFS family permease
MTSNNITFGNFRNWMVRNHPGFLSSGVWFFTGFDLILMILFSTQIEKLYFPSGNLQSSILAVFGTFSISLLARVFGGIYFGRLGDFHGRKPIVLITLLSLTIIMAVSAFLPSVYSPIFRSNIALPTIIFVSTRIMIGFFVGGLWPTAAVLALENLYWNKYENKKDKDKEAEAKTDLILFSSMKFNEMAKILKWQFTHNFKQKTKKLTRESSLLQVGFFLGYFVAWFYVVYFLKGSEVFPFFNNSQFFYYSQGWRSMSLIASFIGLGLYILCLKYLQESKVWKEWRDKWKKESIESKSIGVHVDMTTEDPGITTLLNSKKHLQILLSFWLILSGLMYMYYSTIVTAPELFMRDNIEDAGSNSADPSLKSFELTVEHNFMFILLSMTWVAHIWPGFLSNRYWKRDYTYNTKEQTERFTQIVNKLFDFKKSPTYKKFLKFVGKEDISEYEEEEQNEEFRNVDVRMIITLGFMLIPIGIVGSILFFILPDNIHTRFVYVIYTAFVILVANAGWALVQSMLSSRFPVHIRNTGSSLAYNGGLVIAFASPFIIMEYYLMFKSEFIIFLPMVLGSISMIIGGYRLMHLIVRKEKYAVTEA